MTCMKKILKIITCTLGCGLILSSNVSTKAFWSFSSKSEESVKSALERKQEELSNNRENYKQFFEEAKLLLEEPAVLAADMEKALKDFEVKLKEFDEAYEVWAANGYQIKGASYEKYILSKSECDAARAVLKSKKAQVTSFYKKMLELIRKNESVYGTYKKSIDDSINLYYNYSIALAQNVTLKEN